jgi:hypothetical protein
MKCTGSKKWLANRKRVGEPQGGDCSPMKNASLARNRVESVVVPSLRARQLRPTLNGRELLPINHKSGVARG